MTEPSRSRWGVRLILLVVGGGLFAAGMLLFAAAPEQERTTEVATDAALREVATQRVVEREVQARAVFSGVLEARRTVKLFAETNGPVLSLGAEELDRVESGAALVAIDPVLARVELERARATLARAESELALATSNLERRSELAARNVLSDSVLDDAENRERVAAASVREARAMVRRAREDLDNKTVRAPFAGELRSLPVEAGEYVREGQVLAELVDLATARMKIGVADREIVVLAPGQAVSLRVEAFDDEVFAGTVLRVGSSADPETRRFPVEIEVDNASGRLLPGMVGEVEVALGAPVARTLVPREATLEEFGLRFVWVVEEGAAGLVAKQRRVVARAVAFHPEAFEVVEGLTAGEEIAITGVRELRDGEGVKRKAPVQANRGEEGPA